MTLSDAERARRYRARLAGEPVDDLLAEDPGVAAKRKQRAGEPLTDAERTDLRAYNAAAARRSRARRKASGT